MRLKEEPRPVCFFQLVPNLRLFGKIVGKWSTISFRIQSYNLWRLSHFTDGKIIIFWVTLMCSYFFLCLLPDCLDNCPLGLDVAEEPNSKAWLHQTRKLVVYRQCLQLHLTFWQWMHHCQRGIYGKMAVSHAFSGPGVSLAGSNYTE